MTKMCIVFLLMFLPVAGFAGEDTVETEIGLDQVKSSPPSKTTAQESSQAADMSPQEQQVILINKSLKKTIEENKKLSEEKKTIEDELRLLRGQKEINATRINSLTSQRDESRQRLEQNQKLIDQYSKEIEELKAVIAQKDKDYGMKLKDMEQKKIKEEQRENAQLAKILSNPNAAQEAKKEFDSAKTKAQNSLAYLERGLHGAMGKVQRVTQENKELKSDSAKLHYNLANLFFEQGKYDRSAKEYKKVLEALPNDAAAHYNLAFVSGEFLNDPKTALEHYRQYLMLQPDAPDAPLVHEKILEAQLLLESKIQSPIERQGLHKNHQNTP